MWELCFKSPHVLQINLGSFKFEIRTWSVQIDLVDTKGNMDEALLLSLLNIKHLVSFTARCCRSIPFSKRIETVFPVPISRWSVSRSSPFSTGYTKGRSHQGLRVICDSGDILLYSI